MPPFIIGYILFAFNFLYREVFLRQGDEARKLTGSKYDGGSTMIAAVYITTGFLFPIPLYIFKIGQTTFPDPLLWLGLMLMIAGITLNLKAVKQLGKFYARTLVIQDSHKLVKEGLYRYIRHPGYLGFLSVGLGYAFLSQNIVFLIIILVELGIYLKVRIYFEERMMIHKFGDTYKKYQSKTWRLLPYIY